MQYNFTIAPMNRRKHREYLLQKENNDKEASIVRNKNLLKQHLLSNKSLPNSLRSEAPQLLQEVLYSIDMTEPTELNAIITTSRKPTNGLKKFAKRLSHILQVRVLPRGSLTKDDLNSYMERSDYNMLIVINESRGLPNSVSFFEFPYGPSFLFSLHNVNMKDFKIKGSPYFMADNMTKEKERVKDFFSRLFPMKKCKRAVLVANKNGFICFRHMCNEEIEGFDMRLYEIVRGALDGGEKEWVYKPYSNTTRKKE